MYIPDCNGLNQTLEQNVPRRCVTWLQAERRHFLIRARWMNRTTCQHRPRADVQATAYF